jgi:hypothetical protein
VITRNPLLVTLTALLFLLLPHAHSYQAWQVKGGATSITLYRQMLAGMGLQVKLTQTAAPQGDMEEAVGCALSSSSSLSFRTQTGFFQNWEGGEVVSRGGFELVGKKGSLRVTDFTIQPAEFGGFQLRSGSSAHVFDLQQVKVRFDHARRTLTFGYADLVLRPEAANALGRPDLAGETIGMVTVAATLTFIGGDPNESGPPPPPPPGSGGMTDVPNGDVQLFQLLDCASYGRTGAYPNGLSGLGVGTTSCNVSNITNDNANWYEQMDERHPVIEQNLYRISVVNGAERFEQIGVGWVKHGFLSTNSNGCGTCQVPGAGGAQLGIHCSDTYGSSLNASRSYLGPRNEVNPFTGRWTCRGSYFSNYVNDCVSRFNQSGLDAVAHRLVVKDQDLLAGGTFIYEAYYVSENDVDRYNNIAYKTCVPTWSTAQTRWNFGNTGPQVQGPAILGWVGATKNTAEPTTEGDVIVASKATNVGGGFWHYEYAVYVHTLDRQVRAFTLPVADGVVLKSIEFRDPDDNALNDWTFSRANSKVTWQTETFAQNPNANSLSWGFTFNFRFDANVPPADSAAVLGLFKPGTLQALSVSVKTPANPYTVPTSMIVNPGTVLTGGLADLIYSDDSRVQAQPRLVFSTSGYPLQMVVEGSTPWTAPSVMRFRVESSAPSAISQRIELYNFSTGQYEELDVRSSTPTDTVVEVEATGNLTRFVETGTGKVRARVGYRATGPVLSFPWTASIDHTAWTITP